MGALDLLMHRKSSDLVLATRWRYLQWKLSCTNYKTNFWTAARFSLHNIRRVLRFWIRELSKKTHTFTWSTLITFFTFDPLVRNIYKLTPWNHQKLSLYSPLNVKWGIQKIQMADGYLFEEVKLKKTVSQLFQINTEANITGWIKGCIK